ncbi:MAG TPA: glycosyltransferase [Candidatus Thermoplasmatota archaeon]|nr:glycosyltransferase [Candidatus Thermoplasmatota archaeon]
MVQLSVVVLTRNEEANLADALDSLLGQEGVDLEVLVVDSASTDATLEIARRYEARDPRVRVLAEAHDIPIGEARNLGIEAAAGAIVAQMSADAMAAPGWAAALVAALEDADVVFGRQEHAPPRLTPAAIVRGLRYHHFRSDRKAAPETFASNVNAAMRRDVLDALRFVEEGPASALDDILFTHEAKAMGFRIGYEPRMLVRHKDATTLRGEWRKNRREGFGWAILSPRLGLHKTVLAWAGALLVGLVAFAVWPSLPLALLWLAVLYAPALRRALRGGGPYLRRAPLALAAAVLASPAFDFVFAYHYALGLLQRRRDLTGALRLPE